MWRGIKVCGAVCHGCDDVKCEHMTLCVTLSWEDPDEFRQGRDTVQFMVLKDCSGCRVCGGGVGKAERKRPDQLEATAAQAGVPGLRGGERSWRERDELWRHSEGRNDRTC